MKSSTTSSRLLRFWRLRCQRAIRGFKLSRTCSRWVSQEQTLWWSRLATKERLRNWRSEWSTTRIKRINSCFSYLPFKTRESQWMKYTKKMASKIFQPTDFLKLWTSSRMQKEKLSLITWAVWCSVSTQMIVMSQFKLTQYLKSSKKDTKTSLRLQSSPNLTSIISLSMKVRVMKKALLQGERIKKIKPLRHL